MLFRCTARTTGLNKACPLFLKKKVIYSRELANRLKSTNVTSNSLEPGVVKTSLFEGITDDLNMRKRLENGVSVEEGAKTHVHLATAADVEGVTGEHWEKCKIISQGLAKMKCGPRFLFFIVPQSHTPARANS